MLAFKHSGFSVNAGVCIQAQDRAGLERLLRYCARPPFALERLRQRGAELVYHCPKPQSGGKQADLVLSPLELIERVPPVWRQHAHPCVHHRGGADQADPGAHRGRHPGATYRPGTRAATVGRV